MITKHDLEVFETTGNITQDRLRAAQWALRQRGSDAFDASIAATHPAAAAALRGKKAAYNEAARMLDSLLAGNPLPLPKRVRRINDRDARMRARRRLESEEPSDV